MKTLAKILFCIVVLAACRLSAQETFAPLVTENCVAFIHVDFANVELDQVKDALQQAGEDLLRGFEFDDSSFKSTARELRTELEKLDLFVRPAFDTITKELGIGEVAVIADADLLERGVTAIIAVPWKDKTAKQLDTLRHLLNMENEPINFVPTGNFLILPLADRWTSPEDEVEEWTAEIEPAPKSPIFDALKNVADAEIKLAAAIPERLRVMARSGGMPPVMPNELKVLLLFASQKVQWASASMSLHEILGGKVPKDADVLVTFKMANKNDGIQLRDMLEQTIESGINIIRFTMEQNRSMAFQPPPLFFQFVKGFLRTLLPDVEDDLLKFRLKTESAGAKQAVVATAGVGAALLLPAIQAAGQSGKRVQCVNNLKQIILAFHTYHDTMAALPPLYSVDKDGKPLHSWRVLILPWIEQAALYDAIRLDEPWDSEYNKQFHNVIVSQYSCPSNALCKPGEACNYVVVAGEAFVPAVKDRKGKHTFAVVSDGTSNTLAVIEVKEPFCWMDPTADIELEDLAVGINAEDGRCGSFHRGGCNAARFDGSVLFIPETVDTETLQNFGKCNSGKMITLP